MENFTLIIPKPCSEKWQSFTPTSRGGLCASCEKEVIDFTLWSEEELVAHFRNGFSGCGRFRNDQLKTYEIKPVGKGALPHWLAVLLVVTTILIGRPAIAQSNKKEPRKTELPITDKTDSTRIKMLLNFTKPQPVPSQPVMSPRCEGALQGRLGGVIVVVKVQDNRKWWHTRVDEMLH